MVMEVHSAYYGYHFSYKLQAGYFVGQTMLNNYVRRTVISKVLFRHALYTISIFIKSIGPTNCKKFVV